MTKTENFEGIQLLRGLAALAVVVTHATFYASERLGIGNLFWPNGARGVDLFFIISGFVMVLSTQRLEGQPDGWKVFAFNRIVRIVPIYWLALTMKLVISLASEGLVRHGQFAWWNVVSSYVFIPSYDSTGAIRPFLGVGWTLNFEMFFYLCFCIALAMHRRPWLLTSIPFAIVGLASFILPRSGTAMDFYISDLMLEFVMGMLWAKWMLSGRTLPELAAFFCLLVGGAVMLLLRVPDSVPTVIQSGIPGLLMVIGVTSLEHRLKGRIGQPLLVLGSASYALYLTHPMTAPVVPVLLRKLGLPIAAISIVGSVVLAVIFALLVYRYVERPVTRMLKRGRISGSSIAVTS